MYLIYTDNSRVISIVTDLTHYCQHQALKMNDEGDGQYRLTPTDHRTMSFTAVPFPKGIDSYKEFKPVRGVANV